MNNIDYWLNKKEDTKENLNNIKKYDTEEFTYGFELEIGDVPRNISIPKNLGEWEYSETDVLNLETMTCCDPLGKNPIYGGEINTKPTKTIDEQVEKILKIIDFFRDKGYNPTTNCISHNHIHIHVPDLINDISALKRLTKYIKNNQKVTVENTYNYYNFPGIRSSGTTNYFKYDGGRLMPDWMCDNIINLSTDFDTYILLHSCGKDGKTRSRPLRYAINTYCLKHIKTIEFRCFRHSFEERHLRRSFEFVKKFMESALNNGLDVRTIIKNNNFIFPEFKYNHEQCLAWKKTKYPSTRGKKRRKYYDIEEDN